MTGDNVEDKGRVWVAPTGTQLHSFGDWTLVGSITEVEIVPTFRGAEAGPPIIDETTHFYAAHQHIVWHTDLSFPNMLKYRNYYRIVTGTSQGLRPLIHKGKKPRK